MGCNNLPDELNSLLSQSGSSEDVSLVTSDSEENTSASDSEVNSSASEDDNSSDDETSSDSVNNPVSSDSEDNDSEDNPNVSSEGTTTSSDDPITPSEDTSSTPSTSDTPSDPTLDENGGTLGLEYELNDADGGETAICIGGSPVVGDIIIASTYQGKPVTIIDQDAFNSNSTIKTIKFPSSLKKISGYAFAECKNLTEVNVPEGVEEIGEYAFNQSWIYGDEVDYDKKISKLAKITIPNSVSLIGQEAFSFIPALKTIEFGTHSKLKNIPESAFSSSNAIEKITIPEGVISIGYHAFYHCEGLVELELPNSLETIGCEIICPGFPSTCPFKKIVYHGTANEWKVISKDSTWYSSLPAFTIECVDDNSVLDPTGNPIVVE